MTWQPSFKNLRKGAVLMDIDSRALHCWGEDGCTYKLYPQSGHSSVANLTILWRLATGLRHVAIAITEICCLEH